MELVWDHNQSKVTINHIVIQVSPETLAPFPVSGIIEEQDTSLVLEPTTEIHHPGDKPLWYMANTLELQQSHEPGSVMIKPGKPLRLWAIIHDLDASPSWRSQWIARALANIFMLAEQEVLAAIKLPVLGAQFGQFSLTEFITLLVGTLKQHKADKLERIWLVIAPDACQNTIELLKKFSNNCPQPDGQKFSP